MRKELAVLVAVLAVGYSLYGGLFLGAMATRDALGPDQSFPEDPLLDARNDSAGAVDAYDFALADDGLDYEYETSASGHMKTMTNAGTYAADYDGDGWEDLLAVGGESPVLFENTGGEFEPSGALPPLDRVVRSATFLDYDDDGDEDLVLFADGHPPLLLENVDGTYEKRDAFDEPLPLAWGAATADYDGDGCLDLFVYQNGDWSDGVPTGHENEYNVSPGEDNGNPNVLYDGTCDGFERVDDAGIAGNRWSLAASFVDLTGDGRPDVHVANDINHDVLYVNQGDGSFEQVVMPERTNRNGMSSEVADVTGDGRLDVFVTNIFYPQWAMREINAGLLLKARGNNLISNHGDGTFVMRGEQYGVNVGGWGWAAVITDLDNDGDEDLFHTTRNLTFRDRDIHFTDQEIQRLDRHPFYSHPVVYDRQGHEFASVNAQSSGFLEMNGRGVARLDYDRDGTQDLAVATTDEFRLYENQLDRGGAVQVRVLGEDGSRAGSFGATVTVETAASTQQRHVHGRTDFLSQDSRLVHVGVGDETAADVRIVWPDGRELTVPDVAADTRLVVTPEGVRRTIDLGSGEESPRDPSGPR